MAPPDTVFEFALVLFLNRPGAGVAALLKEGALLKQAIVLETTEPCIPPDFLLTGAEAYGTKVHVDVPVESLWVDAPEEAAAHLVIHRSVPLNVYNTNQDILQRRELLQALLQDNIHLQEHVHMAHMTCDLILSR